MDLFSQVILPLLGAAAGGIAAYAAIRSDLAVLKAQVASMQESLSRAHQRLDDVIGRGK